MTDLTEEASDKRPITLPTSILARYLDHHCLPLELDAKATVLWCERACYNCAASWPLGPASHVASTGLQPAGRPPAGLLLAYYSGNVLLRQKRSPAELVRPTDRIEGQSSSVRGLLCSRCHLLVYQFFFCFVSFATLPTILRRRTKMLRNLFCTPY